MVSWRARGGSRRVRTPRAAMTDQSPRPGILGRPGGGERGVRRTRRRRRRPPAGPDAAASSASPAPGYVARRFRSLFRACRRCVRCWPKPCRSGPRRGSRRAAKKGSIRRRAAAGRGAGGRQRRGPPGGGRRLAHRVPHARRTVRPPCRRRAAELMAHGRGGSFTGAGKPKTTDDDLRGRAGRADHRSVDEVLGLADQGGNHKQPVVGGRAVPASTTIDLEQRGDPALQVHRGHPAGTSPQRPRVAGIHQADPWRRSRRGAVGHGNPSADRTELSISPSREANPTTQPRMEMRQSTPRESRGRADANTRP